MQGDWRLDIESALALRVLAFVRTTDGFLTAMGDVLQRNAEGLLVAQTFNPGSNANQVSKLRLVNTGAKHRKPHQSARIPPSATLRKTRATNSLLLPRR